MVRVHKRFFRLNWTALRVQYVDYVLLSVAITTQYSPRSLYTLCANLAGFDHEMGREKNEKTKKKHFSYSTPSSIGPLCRRVTQPRLSCFRCCTESDRSRVLSKHRWIGPVTRI